MSASSVSVISTYGFKSAKAEAVSKIIARIVLAVVFAGVFLEIKLLH